MPSAQEAARYVTYASYMRLLQGLDGVGMRPALSGVGDDGRGCMPAAVAAGLGFGLTQAFVFYGDVLWHSSHPGSMYSDACAHLSTFAVDALTCFHARPGRPPPADARARRAAPLRTHARAP